MPDWTKPMQQTFEYYTVDPITWKDVKKLTKVKSCTINYDAEVDTLGSASIDFDESIGECYVRAYLITIQNGIKEKHPLGTVLVQTPRTSFDGKVSTTSVDAYTPLLELKDDKPMLGYYIPKGTNIMDIAYELMSEHMRAPVVRTSCSEKLQNDFVANTDDNWLTYIRDLIAMANYILGLDEMGRILFLPKQDAASLRPVHTYDDGNSSILYPEATLYHDIYGIPNIVQVTYADSSSNFNVEVVNDDVNSPISTVNRGRRIVHRVTNPSFSGAPSTAQLKLYAEQLLRELSTVEYKVSYTHGYRPSHLHDCVQLDYTRANLVDVKAKILTQAIKCQPGCPVSESSIFTKKLWG